METVDVESLAEYPELPSFSSCFNYFGRTILPPLITTERRKELKNFRDKAILIEKKLEEEKQKNELLTIVQEVIDVVVEIQKDRNSENKSTNDSQSVDCQITSSESSSPVIKTNPGSNVHYEEILDNSEDQKMIMLKCRINNWIPDSNTDVKKTVNNQSKALSVFTVVDQNQYPCCESDIQSSNQSTDLDKYLDTSIEYEHLSSVSSTSDMSPDIPDTVISLGESSETLDNSSRTLTPSENVSSDNLDPFVCSSDIVTNVPHSNLSETNVASCFSLENKNSACNLNNHQSWLSKVLSNSLPPKDVSKSANDLVNDNLPYFPPRLVRSNSYTLDSPSPVLIMSHLGCQCPECPKSVTSSLCHLPNPSNDKQFVTSQGDINHNVDHRNDSAVKRDSFILSQSHENEDLEIKNDPPLCSVFSESNSDDSLGVAPPEVISQNSLPSGNISELSNSSYINYVGEQSSEEQDEGTLAKELYNKFIEIRKKTLMDLQMDHMKQLEAIKEKFDIKERELREKLLTLSLSTSKGSESIYESVSNCALSTPPCSTQELNSPLTPSCDLQESAKQSPSTPSPCSKNAEQFSPESPCCNEQPVKQSFLSCLPSNTMHSDAFISTSTYHGDKNQEIPSTPPLSERYKKPFSTNPSFSPISEMRSHIANNNNMMSEQKRLKSLEKTINDPEMQKKYEKVTALAKGFLTRRLWRSHRVQGLINGIKVSAQEMVDIKQSIINGGRTNNPTEEDIARQKEVFDRVSHMDNMLDCIFFGMNAKERMAIIAETRELERRQTNYALPLTFVTQRVNVPSPGVVIHKHKLSSATLKSLERKKRSHDKNLTMQGTKKPLHERFHAKRYISTITPKPEGVYRKRILSPRSCPISPPKHRSNSSPLKKETAKSRRTLY